MAAVLLLTPKVRKIVNDYDRQRKEGLDPAFEPKALSIEGAEWNKVYPVIDAMISEPFIAALKKGLDLQGFPIGSPRAPMADVSAAAAARIEQALKNLNA